MFEQKPIRTFTTKDNDGNNHTINVFPSITNLKGSSTPSVTYKNEVFYTSDGIELFPTDEETYVSEDESLVLTVP